ncbi:DUF397 domain-containing protein [Sphaerisporangium sp. B11E5]|uniref:DUF397 domain-containing protein n=1 Tax=Sphaerisporangium sp. B11E5 TaxID=3153563 RepID=UPI00325CF630
MVSDLRNAEWRKSSFSGDEGGNCVEVAWGPAGLVAVRDSKDTGGAVVMCARREWSLFLGAVKAGIPVG